MSRLAFLFLFVSVLVLGALGERWVVKHRPHWLLWGSFAFGRARSFALAPRIRTALLPPGPAGDGYRAATPVVAPGAKSTSLEGIARSWSFLEARDLRAIERAGESAGERATFSPERFLLSVSPLRTWGRNRWPWICFYVFRIDGDTLHIETRFYLGGIFLPFSASLLLLPALGRRALVVFLGMVLWGLLKAVLSGSNARPATEAVGERLETLLGPGPPSSDEPA